MNRSELRESIFKLLFISAFNSSDEMPEQLMLYFETLEQEHAGLSEQDQTYMQQKFWLVCEHREHIDRLLNKNAAGWKTSRMSKADLNILRLAVYEMVYDGEIPLRVAINEAVEIAKRFGGDESASFINGILGKIARQSFQAADKAGEKEEGRPS